MVEEKIQVRGGQQGRCPFCHDAVPRDQRVACVACLAAHHAACWDEHGKCSSCGEAEALRREGGGSAPAPAAPRVDVTVDARPARQPWQVEPQAEAERSEGHAWQVDPTGSTTQADALSVVFLFVTFGVLALALAALAQLT